MGVCASLFFSSNDAEKQTLHRRITPSAEQLTQQQERWNMLADYLRGSLSAVTGLPVRTWLQGSYKFGTQVRPTRRGQEFDIDLGVYLVWDGEPEDGPLTAKQLKQYVQHSLHSYDAPEKTEVVEPPKERCARIRFSGRFHIDVPGYHLEENWDQRALATENHGWEFSDPKALYQWFRDQFDDQTRARVRRQIQYLKVWAGLHLEDELRPSSTLLTVLVAEESLYTDFENLGGDDEAFEFIVFSILTRLQADRSVPNPVDTDEDLAARLGPQGMDGFIRELIGLSQSAARANDQTEALSAAMIWSDVFSHFFPMPDIDGMLAPAGTTAPALLYFSPQIDVVARADNNPNRTWSGRNGVGPIPKKCSIDFLLVNSPDLPQNAHVIWMVRNEGKEAELASDLGHPAGSGYTATETSAYHGSHYMDCVVTVGSQVIGARRVPVKITGTPMPPRKPQSATGLRAASKERTVTSNQFSGVQILVAPGGLPL